MSQADNQRDLEIFLDDGGQVRLVNDLISGKPTGVAFKNPGDWDWQMVRVEGTEGRLFRETATNLITKQLAQAVPGISPPSSLDDALNKAETILSPKIILSKMANAGAQAVAYHVGLGHIAPALGKVTEQIVISLPSPDSTATEVLNGASDLVVTYDLKDGHLTEAVRDSAADKIDNIINKHTEGITPGELRDIQASLQQKHNAGETEPPEPPRPDDIDEDPPKPDFWWRTEPPEPPRPDDIDDDIDRTPDIDIGP